MNETQTAPKCWRRYQAPTVVVDGPYGTPEPLSNFDLYDDDLDPDSDDTESD